MQLDPKTTTLVLIGLQDGVLGRSMAPPAAADVLARGKGLAERCRRAGAPVVQYYSRTCFVGEPRARWWHRFPLA